MDFSSVDGLKAAGFIGFEEVQALQAGGWAALPAEPGVYLVVRSGAGSPKYLPKSVGGWPKGKNPTVGSEVLNKHWVAGAIVLYVGKADGTSKASTLRRRVHEYLRFGQGKPVGHWGGRLIWQLADHQTLIVCWKSLPAGQPSPLEQELIGEFRQVHGARPFANLIGGIKNG